jgi:hypothetical protein
MNILIIGTLRVGGLYLMKSLANTYGLETMHEPVPSAAANSNIIKNKVVKMIICFKYMDLEKDYWLDVVSNYDHVIILNRKPTLEYYQSIYQILFKTDNMWVNWTWNEVDEEEIYKSKDWKWTIDFVNKMNVKLKEVSKILKQKIVYYDDLYYNKSSDYLNGLEFNPDLNKKLRKSAVKKSII